VCIWEDISEFSRPRKSVFKIITGRQRPMVIHMLKLMLMPSEDVLNPGNDKVYNPVLEKINNGWIKEINIYLDEIRQMPRGEIRQRREAERPHQPEPG